MDKRQAYKIFKLLKTHYPQAKMILQWQNNFELLVSIILSAQCTDKKVNEVTSILFPKYRKTINKFYKYYNNYKNYIHLPKEELTEMINFSNINIKELERDIRPTGFYHNKAKHVQAAAKVVLEKYKGVLPKSIKDLITIPGVGRKTANVFLGNAFHIYEGIAVDTHVIKQSRLLGLSKNTHPEKIEQDLMALFNKKDWFVLTYLLIEHGRNMRRKQSDQLKCNDEKCILCYSKKQSAIISK